MPIHINFPQHTRLSSESLKFDPPFVYSDFMTKNTICFSLYFLTSLAAVFSILRCDAERGGGRQLAESHCSSCHLFPEPALLPKGIWENGIFPAMEPYLGITTSLTDTYAQMDKETLVRVMTKGVFPKKPMLDSAEWQRIRLFYLREAPDSLTKPPALKYKPLSTKFDLQTVRLTGAPGITMLKFDTLAHQLYAGIQNRAIMKLDSNFALAGTLQLNSTPSDAIFEKNRMLVLQMGIMNPSDAYKGEISAFDLPHRMNSPGKVLLEKINRPVAIKFADLLGDGQDEMIVCEYGHLLGSLFWCETDQDGNFKEKHILKEAPGCRTAIPTDVNGDGLTDILALFAQGNESLVLFKNQGEGKFEERVLQRFPPVYGSSYIELADMNGDGFPDIVYANGDNGDYSAVFKPYHGIRIFVNNGQWDFSEDWFYPMNGAGKTICRDFDGDGDMDMAAISFFPDLTARPQEGFLFFENIVNPIGPGQKLQFEAYGSQESMLGRWMVMESGDLDSDGDEDLVLGSFINAPRMGIPSGQIKKWAVDKVSLLVLWNKNG